METNEQYNKIVYKDQTAYLGDSPLSNDFMYISDGTWFVKGSVCWLSANCGEGGCLMIGVRSSDNRLDEELCSWDEFDIHDQNRTLVLAHEE